MSMPDTLLKTKLYIPPLRPELVPRPQLIERLNEGLRRKLTLISAPPGFGKTTLVSSWIYDLRFTIYDLSANPANKAKIVNRVAWFSLDELDNDPTRFWSYVIAGLNTIQAGVGADALTLLQSPQATPPAIELILTALINALTGIPDHFLLVLDDYHIIKAESIHQALTFLLEHLPPTMHLVMTSRADPPLPLTRLRAQNQLVELRERDLRFTSIETATFLNQVMGLNLSPEETTALETRTEGWAAGLQLAALSMQGRSNADDFVQVFAGSHRFIIDYLAEEVLARQPEHIRTFLLRTSILERLSGPLCDALFGENETQNRNSQSLLHQLERANLFLIPLDNERSWYRYHHLFASFLQTHLKQTVSHEEWLTLHRRASAWYAAHGFTAEAVSHVLTIADFVQAAHLIEQAILTLLINGEVSTVTNWLKALPEALIQTRPRLALGWAWAMVITMEWATIEPLVNATEKQLSARVSSDQNDLTLQGMLGEVAALQAIIAGNRGDHERAIELCQRALARLPKDNLTVRSIITFTLGGTYEYIGELDQASRILNETILLSQAAGNLIITLSASRRLALIREAQGRLHQAAELYRQALQLVEKRATDQGRPDQPLLIAGGVYLGLAEILREQNDLEQSKRYLAIGLRLAQQESILGGNTAVAYLIQARLLQALGDEAGAIQSIQQAEQVLLPHSPVRLWVAAIRARLWLVQGNLAAAAQWAEQCELPLAKIDYVQYPGEYTTLARIMIAQHKFAQASKLLDQIEVVAESTGQQGRLAEINMLQALTLHAQGKTEQALKSFIQALTLAEPGDYIRLFVDEGTAIAELLRLIKSRSLAPNEAYLDKLLTAFSISSPLTVAQAPKSKMGLAQVENFIIEPLSERELEVLQLIAAGLSNREIAQKLVITVGTAKTHANNIYRKLDVRSRTQAVARATELGLVG
jgi:LuxR family maltose regulon positive regulatory protein